MGRVVFVPASTSATATAATRDAPSCRRRCPPSSSPFLAVRALPSATNLPHLLPSQSRTETLPRSRVRRDRLLRHQAPLHAPRTRPRTLHEERRPGRVHSPDLFLAFALGPPRAGTLALGARPRPGVPTCAGRTGKDYDRHSGGGRRGSAAAADARRDVGRAVGQGDGSRSAGREAAAAGCRRRGGEMGLRERTRCWSRTVQYGHSSIFLFDKVDLRALEMRDLCGSSTIPHERLCRRMEKRPPQTVPRKHEFCRT